MPETRKQFGEIRRAILRRSQAASPTSANRALHLTLKKEATRPPGSNSLQQQARFDDFVREFNTERPHEALGMKTPAQMYPPPPRPYSGLAD